jgi:hypothetical protein
MREKGAGSRAFHDFANGLLTMDSTTRPNHVRCSGMDPIKARIGPDAEHGSGHSECRNQIAHRAAHARGQQHIAFRQLSMRRQYRKGASQYQRRWPGREGQGESAKRGLSAEAAPQFVGVCS